MAYNSTLSSENIESALNTVHEAITIGGGILSLTSESDSSAISDVVGGTSGFDDLLTKARAKNISFGIVVDESSMAGVTMASILADKTEAKLTISFAYNQTFIKDVITLSGSNFTLEQTALPLTGNITYHTHDTTYTAQELETDVWDGTTVSTSWSGSGTEEDPFLIQSCADYIYFLIGKIDATESDGDLTGATMRYVKITKNLDFDNKEIPTVQKSTTDPESQKYVRSRILLDGNGCIVKNFSVETPSVSGDDLILPMWYLPYMMPAFVHDINFVRVKWKVPLGDSNALMSILPYITFANVVFDLTVETTGEYDDVTLLPVVYNYLSTPGMEAEMPIARICQDYVAEKGCFFGIDIKAQSIPQNGLGVNIFCANPFSGYDMSLYNWEGGNFDGSSIGQNMALAIIGNYDDFRLSTLSSGKFFYQSLEGNPITVEAKVISPEDLKSQSYINEINTEHQRLTLSPNYDIPLIGSMQIENDGYIKQSLFNKYQEKIASLEGYRNKQLTTYRILDMAGSSASSEEIEAFVNNFRSDLATQGLNFENTLFYILSDGVKPVIIDDVPNELIFTWFRGDTCYCRRFKRLGGVWSTTSDTYDFIDKGDVLAKNNTVSYTPTADYHPATKKYVDDSLPKVDFVSIAVTKLAGDSLRFRGFYENELVDIELPCTHIEESSESPYTFEHYEVEITESTNSTLFKILSTVQSLYSDRYSYPDSPVETIQTRIKPEVFLDNYYPVHPVDGILLDIESSSSPGFYAFVRGADSSTGAAIKIKGMTTILAGVKFILKYFPNVKWNFN